MGKQTFTAGQVLTAAEMNSLQENDYNWTVTTKTASYTLAAGDEGTRIVMDNAGATTITVDDAVFSAGDVVWLHNIGAGTCTVTAGTATVNTAASLDLAQWEGGSLYFTSASSAIFFRGPAAGVANANFTDTATGTFSSGGTNYKYLIYTSSGTVTFDTDGLADFLVVAGGGGSNTFQSSAEPASAGGGAGGCLEALGFYITAGTYTVTVGAGGAGINRWARNANGGDSSVGTVLQALGGGGGGYGTTVNDAVSGHQSRAAGGGSGGGCGYGWGIDTNSKGGEAVPGQGNRGGDYYYGGSNNVGGGGGGWGAQGGPTGTNQPCDGGIGGISTIVTAAIATANSIGEVSGSDVYYGGGGAGNAKIATYDGTGGLGGGGDIGNAGTANTGGGGGAGTAVVPNVGYNGGSGVVIIRVAV